MVRRNARAASLALAPASALAPALALALALSACAPGGDTSLAGAARNYPPLILGANTQRSQGVTPLACPAPGAKVEQAGGPAFEYEGADPSNPDLCRIKIGDDQFKAWYGIWMTHWPGADAAYPVLGRVLHGPTGTVEGIDVNMAPGFRYHDLMRNEGVEDIQILDATYHALKISHYREGFDGNIYRSVSTVWKDIPTGMLIYGTYQHISGKPVIDDPIIPTAITPAPAHPQDPAHP